MRLSTLSPAVVLSPTGLRLSPYQLKVILEHTRGCPVSGMGVFLQGAKVILGENEGDFM